MQDPLPGLLMDQCLVRYGLSITEIYELYTSQMITSSGYYYCVTFGAIFPSFQSCSHYSSVDEKTQIH